MSANKLLWRNALQINNELFNAKDDLENIIYNPPLDTLDSDIEELKKKIEKLKEELMNTDEERCYLVKNTGEVIIDFWVKYESNRVEEFKKDEIIQVEFDYENGVRYILLDFNGNELTESCIDFEFIGNKIKYLQTGFEIGQQPIDGLFWKIAYSEIRGRVIKYNEDFDVYEVDDWVYNSDLECLGKKINDEAGVLLAKKENYLSVLLNSGLLFEIEDKAKNIISFNHKNQSAIIYKYENFVKLILSEGEIERKKTIFTFNKVYIFDSLYETIIIGINNTNNITESFSFYSKDMTIERFDEPVSFRRQTFNQVLNLDPILFSLLDIQVID